MSESTVRCYLDAPTGALVTRQLPPRHANIKKRQVRSLKVCIRDTGLLHRLLGIDDHASLLANPKLGACWEGFVIEQLVTRNDLDDVHFWRTQAGAEIDLGYESGGLRTGLEIKRTDASRVTPSMRHALEDLGLDRIIVAHAGTDRFALAEKIEAIGSAELLGDF